MMISTGSSYLDRPDDGDDHIDAGQYDEERVLLAGNLIDLAKTNSLEGSRYLYRTKVYIDQGDLQALLLLYDAKLLLIAVRAGQEGRNLVRYHTWTYEQIKRVSVPDNKNRMLLSADHQQLQGGNKYQVLDISYSSKLVCDSFLVRINILKKIYSNPFRKFQTQLTTNQPSPLKPVISDSENINSSEETNSLRDQQATCTKSEPMDDLFSIENLTKLRTAKPEELVVPEVPRAAIVALMQPPPPSSSNSTNDISNLNLNSRSIAVSDTKVKIPIELNLGQSESLKLNGEATISYKINFDLPAIISCGRIQDKEERIKKIRTHISIGDSMCELKFI